MSVGGVLRMGWRVGTIVGVNVGAGVTVGSAVGVNVSVGGSVEVLVGSLISGTGATCATGVQALLHKTTMRKRSAMCFKEIPPGDEVSRCTN
jgi:hypothetical protein